MRRRWLLALPLLPLAPRPAAAEDGLVTVRSNHDEDGTISRFEGAARARGLHVFGEIDHAAAARAAGAALEPRTVILFGDPANGAGAMAAHPTLGLDLPMRVLVWQDKGGVFVTRSTGADLAQRVFARHGVTIPVDQQEATEALLAALVRDATR
jgi:uncharacterized protein (DUF302 family)